MNFTGSEHPVFKNPFTVVDRHGSVWSVATDRIWLVAAKDKNLSPRYKGDTGSLMVILKLLGLTPVNGHTVDRERTLAVLPDESSIRSVLGVPVNVRRLRDLFESLPEPSVTCWNASEALAVPALGVTCAGWQAILVGFDDVVEVPEVSLVLQEKTAFELAMSLDED